MRICKITVRGQTGKFAAITRREDPPKPARKGAGKTAEKPPAATIEVEIIEPEGERMLRAPANNRQHLWRVAEVVQERLDGFRGAGGDVRDYFDLIERIAEL